MDRRDFVRRWYEEFNQQQMTVTVLIENDDGEEEELEVPVEYAVCDTCNGKGRHVNPSIDSHGLSAEDFAEDPDFAEDYFAGRYDMPCVECNERRVVPVIHSQCEPGLRRIVEKKIQADYDDAICRTREREMGY